MTKPNATTTVHVAAATATSSSSPSGSSSDDLHHHHHHQHAVMDPLVQVSEEHALDPLAARLLALKAWLADDLVALEQAVDEVCTAPSPDLAHNAAGHLLALPGKRIRPLCVILAAKLGGRDLDDTVRDLAVSCELVHAATLLHDDVIDMGEERRGEPTARLIYGNSASILGGDYLLIEALRRVAAANQPKLLNSLLTVIDRMVHAEALQLERRKRFDPDRAVYLEVIEGKTASLFRWGLHAGATVAGLDARIAETLGEAGLHFGMAFQLTDDLLDLAGDPATTGKSAFTDLREGKLTWPLIEASERDPEFAEELAAVAILDEDDDDAAGYAGSAAWAEEIVAKLDELGAIEATQVKAAHHAAEALRHFRTLPQSRARQGMEAMVEAVVSRRR